jgi:hypothetical protein
VPAPARRIGQEAHDPWLIERSHAGDFAKIEGPI